MAFCEVGIQFPNIRSGTLKEPEGIWEMHRFNLSRRKSQYCDTIKNEMLGMTARDAARFFCTDSETGKEVFKEERGLGWYYNTIPEEPCEILQVVESLLV